MKTETLMEELLRWRLARAEVEAPRAPRGAVLLEFVRPWWEVWPERFQSIVERLGNIRVVYGHAMEETKPARGGHPVPSLILFGGQELETAARVLYLNVRDGRLRLRFKLDAPLDPEQKSLDVTFVCEESRRPAVTAQASLSLDNEYRIDKELPEDLARGWEKLRVTDRMPFRLIFRAN